MTNKFKKVLLIVLAISGYFLLFPKVILAFTFVAWADTKSGTATLKAESPQVNSLNPAFTIFPGDLCSDGPSAGCFTTWKNALNGGTSPGNGLFEKTFITRGNHDSGGTAFFVANFNAQSVASKVGATNLSQLNTNLTYSFDYGNSHFAGIDLPAGDVSGISAAQISWLDNDLTEAKNRGLTHAFLFWHGPLYPVGSHCCSKNLNLNNMLNKHKIISATFHGHEHLNAYVHMDTSRYPEISHEYEQFISGDAGAGPASAKPERYDWYIGAVHGFMGIDVNGNSYTVKAYQLGNTTPVKTWTFTKEITGPTATPTPRTSTPPIKNPDINSDGKVNIIDIGIIIDNYGRSPITNLKTDLNSDNAVNIVDIGIAIDHYTR